MEGLSIYPRRALVGSRLCIGMGQNVLTIDLVVEHVEAVSRLVLRLAIQLDLKFPDLTRCCQTHRQSPLLASFTSTPEVRALSSAGITRPHRSSSPLRLPDWPPPFLATFGAATPSQSRASLTDLRSPSLHAVLNTPVDRIRCLLVGELRVPARVSSLSVQPSPLAGRVGVHIVTFEACSSFTRVTACRVAHPPYVGFITRLHPCRFPGSGARKLLTSTNNLLRWVLPPLVICAVEARPLSPHFEEVNGKPCGLGFGSKPFEERTRLRSPDISIERFPSS